MDAVVVGIDVSQEKLDVHVLPSGEAFAVSNDEAGIEALTGRLAGVGPSLVALEAIVGVGISRRVSAVRWNVARGIVVAWVVTMPAAGILSALAFLAAGPFLR